MKKLNLKKILYFSVWALAVAVVIAIVGVSVSRNKVTEPVALATENEIRPEEAAVAETAPMQTVEVTKEEPETEKKTFRQKVKELLAPEEEETVAEEPLAINEPVTIDGELLPEDEVYRILCIGDSVTSHPYVRPEESAYGYWLQTWGMAASAEDKDYSHVLASMYEEDYTDVELAVCNYNNWELAEASGMSRDTFLPFLDQFLNENLDLVVLQLGENCTAYQALSVDFANLIDYVRQRAPDAKIAVTGTVIIMEPERNAVVDQIKRAVSDEKGCTWVDMSGYNESMWVGEGTQIVNPEGQVTVISISQHTHPGDYGMQWIAEQIYQAMHR